MACTGNCNRGRFCDCAQEFTDSELGIEPPSRGFRWDILVLYVGTAGAVISTALLLALHS